MTIQVFGGSWDLGRGVAGGTITVHSMTLALEVVNESNSTVFTGDMFHQK